MKKADVQAVLGISDTLSAKLAAQYGVAMPTSTAVKERATDPRMEPIRVRSDIDDGFNYAETRDQAKPGNIGEPGVIHRHMG